jgi:hypothetical protein
MTDRRAPDAPEDEGDGIVDGGAEAVEDIAEEFLDGDRRRDPTPGPPTTFPG